MSADVCNRAPIDKLTPAFKVESTAPQLIFFIFQNVYDIYIYIYIYIRYMSKYQADVGCPCFSMLITAVMENVLLYANNTICTIGHPLPPVI